MLARYARQEATSACPPPGAQDGTQFSIGTLTVSHAILLSGRRVGTLVMLYELDEIAGRVKIYGATVLGVLLVSSLIAFLLTSRLRAVDRAPYFATSFARPRQSRRPAIIVYAHRNFRATNSACW